MAVMRVVHGTENTELTHGLGENLPTRSYAMSVGLAMNPSLIGANFTSAPEPVSTDITRKTKDTTTSTHVKFAGKHFSSASTTNSELAHDHVVESYENGKRDVYNLTVEGKHEYFANGILVGNCDALVWALHELVVDAEEDLVMMQGYVSY
jgi:hypothetical protein